MEYRHCGSIAPNVLGIAQAIANCWDNEKDCWFSVDRLQCKEGCQKCKGCIASKLIKDGGTFIQAIKKKAPSHGGGRDLSSMSAEQRKINMNNCKHTNRLIPRYECKRNTPEFFVYYECTDCGAMGPLQKLDVGNTEITVKSRRAFIKAESKLQLNKR